MAGYPKAKKGRGIRDPMPVKEGVIWTIGKIYCDKCGREYIIKCNGKKNWLE